MTTTTNNTTTSVKDVGRLTFPFPCLDPFLFCAWHIDDFPPGNDAMEAPRLGNGADFDSDAPYRMYHGEKVPGFPQHPHRGFETMTCTLQGLTDHTDSLGNAGRYGNGDLQWMTAGRGIVHGENFPLINQDGPNLLRMFQIWLNLPKARKLCTPTFVMHWAEQIKTVEQADGARIKVFAGQFADAKGLPPPPDSWAVDPNNEVAVWHVELPPGARVVLPAARIGREANRRVFLYDSPAVTVDGQRVSGKHYVTLHADAATTIVNDSNEPTGFLMLQGRPIKEPVAQRGPFVMNTNAEIMQTMMEYQKTQFGGWPWTDDAVIFPRDKPRFALINGKEEYPPSLTATSK